MLNPSAAVHRRLHQDQLLDLTVIHGDGTSTAAKKGGDNLGYSGHRHQKGDKVVAFCDRRCNVIAPFVSAPGNHNESPLLRDALPILSHMVRAIGMACKAQRSAWTASTTAGPTARRFSTGT
ncbi:hypothetical protein [Paraburkholderia sp. RL18-085-BIA-A]|uniref:hypothetical protein n=1 Tax=Paraburkholderia sp. RL18-085-BIA-A TaxID=3031633 RepID=UPI0038BD2AC8